MTRETYFSLDSIALKGERLRDQYANQRHDFKAQFNPAKSALLVLDMQRFFLDQESHAFIPSAPAIIPGVLLLIQRFIELDRPVIFTRHINNNSNAHLMKMWWQDLIRHPDPLSQLIAEFSEYSDNTIEKSQYNAFYNTDLESEMRLSNTKQVIITGIMTHLCCETTARSAFMKRFQPIFPVDGTATYREDYHRATLLNLSHGFALLPTVKEILEIIEASDG